MPSTIEVDDNETMSAGGLAASHFQVFYVAKLSD
jgi:hypothetical protein